MVSLMSLEDVGALLLGPSSLTADPFGPLLDEDEERSLSGPPSPRSSSCSLSPLCPSPLPEPLSWTLESELMSARAGDAFSGMDWMAEKLDLNDFDLDSLIGSCDSDEPPSSPEELLACLDADMDLNLDALPFGSDLGLPLGLDLPPPGAPERLLEPVEIKGEPASPAGPDASGSSDPLEVSVLQLELSPAHVVLLLTPKEELSAGDPSDSDSGISVSGSPHPSSPGSSRTKPYSRPHTDAAPASTGRVKAGPKVVERKLKKMEQNKTAATRYRQKKRDEQETLNAECRELEQKNRALEEKAESISREIQYLTGLMEEVRNAKRRRSAAKTQE